MSNKLDLDNNHPRGFRRVGVGTTLDELIAQVNALTVAHNAMATKLDSDAGVSGTNYLATTGVTATDLKTIDERP
jgi:hypothetical protein